ncbi:hypothetical protein BD779DRAFT_1477363 [Infundibulicybe gibba]|nr:hypothetical protein BD779DRAFT_1477363 [Infundibulicybe gibba]
MAGRGGHSVDASCHASSLIGPQLHHLRIAEVVRFTFTPDSINRGQNSRKYSSSVLPPTVSTIGPRCSHRHVNTSEYWLLKAEPETRIVKGKDVKFSVDDFEAVKTSPWEGIAGFAEVSKEHYPDHHIHIMTRSVFPTDNPIF